MSVDLEDSYQKYPVFKGLQKPLECMGLQGRYITWAAITAGLAMIAFVGAYFLAGVLVGLIALVSVIATGGILIFVKQRKGLHTKKEDHGIFVYAYAKKL